MRARARAVVSLGSAIWRSVCGEGAVAVVGEIERDGFGRSVGRVDRGVVGELD